ncbi:MAG: hypothetical protein ACRC8K_06795 [Waterburya sp.]
MLRALCKKITTIPDSFNNCSIYVCKDILTTQNRQSQAKKVGKLARKIYLIHIDRIADFI